MQRIMRSVVALVVAVALVLVALGGSVSAAPPPNPACWGAATAVFAHMGEMGEHAAQQPTPRLGLANLARALYDAGVINSPTLGALGAFVAAELDLSIEECQ